MSIRYSDLDNGSNGTRDFVIRKRTPTILQLVIIFLSVLLIATSISIAAQDRIQMLIILFIMIIIVGWYVIVVIQRNRDLVLATEFQNALFASALGLNNKFCMIIKRDGNIVYIDRAFQEIFPDFVKQSRRTIDLLLEQGNVSREDSNKIYAAIEQGVYNKVVFEIRGSGKRHKMIMAIEPIMRPSGFILLRGREYIETRSEEEFITSGASPSLMNKSSITLFSHVMDSMNMGVYMTGPNGSMVYVNPVLEQWLGYKEGEISSGNLFLQDIISQGGKRSETIEPDNFEGEVMLQKKTGGLMKSFINQKVIRDEQGKIMGCTALVHNFVEQADDVKKKLW
jgi:two-component system cell cycle sensor histidine kinase/response regulator CckA